MRILVAEDEDAVRRLLVRTLERRGHAVDACATAAEALWYATEVEYDAITLDVNLPDADGFEVCRTLREREVWTPILLLTGRVGIGDRVSGLDAGADDYLVKPFSGEELLARLRAITRRVAARRPPTLTAGDLVLDPAARRASRGDVALELTAREFGLLELLVRRQGEVVSRAEIQEKLWDFAYEGDSNVVDVTVRRLRLKADRPFGRSTIRTVRGMGYSLVPDA